MITPDWVHMVELGVTNKCSLQCPHCESVRYGLFDAPRDDLPLEHLVVFLDKLPNLKTILLEGAYSDQILYPHMLEVVEYCKQRGIIVKLCTHGSARSSHWWERLAALLDENDLVRFAVDGSTQELHEKYRINSRLERVLDNHRTLKDNSEVKTSLQHIVFEYNKHDTDNIVELYKQEGFDYCEIIPCGNSHFTKEMIDEGLVPPEPLLSTYIKNNQVVADVGCSTNFTCDSRKRHEIYINHRGEVVLCADHDTMAPLPVNIVDSTIEEVFDYLNNPGMDTETCYEGCNPLQYNIGVKFPTTVHGVNDEPTLVHFHTRELT